jgi:hypothetical protein
MPDHEDGDEYRDSAPPKPPILIMEKHFCVVAADTLADGDSASVSS